MRVAKWFGLVAVAVLMSATAPAQEKGDLAKKLVGKWEVKKADAGTVPEGTLVEFSKDGKMKVSAKKDGTEMAFEGTYKVGKDSFTMTLKVGEMEKSQTIKVTEITETMMKTEGEDGKKVELERKKGKRK
jgi:uncharacterized protein (TIGR03066 family)